MTVHNKNAMTLCLIGGAMLIASGISGLMNPEEIPNGLVNLFGSEILVSVTIIMGILAILTCIGGIGIIIGGIFLTRRSFEHSLNLIMLALAMAVLGLTMNLIQHVFAVTFVMNFQLQVSQSIGWIGAILSLTARIIAEQKPLIE